MARKIVVGVDGSEGSVAALRWALEEAQRREARVDVIHAWHHPYTDGMAAYTVDQEEHERRILDRSLAAAGPAAPGVRVETILTHGGAASILLDAAKGADLLVVGSRGRGGFLGVLLGSVSQHCAHHTPCPLVIVPRPATES